jgi:hypothetical protein
MAQLIGANTPAIFNGITRLALLSISGKQLVGEGLLLHVSGFHHPASLVYASQQ